MELLKPILLTRIVTPMHEGVRDARTIASSVRERDHRNDANLYRTRWLAAHNRLHEIVHGQMTADERAAVWADYLAALDDADYVASNDA